MINPDQFLSDQEVQSFFEDLPQSKPTQESVGNIYEDITPCSSPGIHSTVELNNLNQRLPNFQLSELQMPSTPSLYPLYNAQSPLEAWPVPMEFFPFGSPVHQSWNAPTSVGRNSWPGYEPAPQLELQVPDSTCPGYPIPPASTLGPDMKKRRRRFRSFQLVALEEEFQRTEFLTRSRRYQLSESLNLDEKQIKVWFQNRRMKKKKASKGSGMEAGTSTDVSDAAPDALGQSESAACEPNENFQEILSTREVIVDKNTSQDILTEALRGIFDDLSDL